MTTYDFDQIFDRRGTDSIKWRTYPPDVLPLYAADMDFPSPPAIAEALHTRINHGFFGYPAEPFELRELLVERLARLYGWKIAPEAIVFVPRIAEGVIDACRAVADAGADIVLPTPIYCFVRVLTDAGFNCLHVPMIPRADGQLTFDFDRLEAAGDDKTRLLFLCNPHNPIGRVYTEAELRRLAELCQRRRLVIVSDEVYSDLVFSGHRHIPIAALDEDIAARTFTVMGPGKSFNIAGLRCAWIIAQDAGLRDRLQKVVTGQSSEVGVLGWVAALAAYRGGQEWLEQVLRYLEGNRDFVYDYVRRYLPGVEMAKPEGTYVAWLDCRQAGIVGNPSEFFLREARVAVNDGVLFGASGESCVRLVFGSPRKMLQEGLERMRVALEKSRR